ncbi:MAG TPA: tetratricopeptide repeat protein [Candidatus Hypogeohydataceae bacterium YC40]
MLKEAEVTYKEILSAPGGWSKSVELHNNLGIVYTYQGRLDEAIKEYTLAAKLATENPSKVQHASPAKIHVNLGRVYYRKSLLDAATQEFNKALELDPQQSGAHEGLGRVLMARGKPEEARASLEKALTSTGMGLPEGRFLKRAEIRSVLAKLNAQLGKGDIAIYQWLEVVELKLKEIERLDDLGLSCFDKGDLQQAFFYWQKSLSLEPSIAVAYEHLGRLYTSKEMLNEALLVYRNAAGFYREPGKKAQMYLQLGNLHYDRWELEEAINDYLRAIEIEPGLALAYTRLGRVYSKKGLLEKAEREHKKALELDPKLAEAHRNLGVCYDKQAQPGPASKEFKKYLELTQKE